MLIFKIFVGGLVHGLLLVGSGQVVYHRHDRIIRLGLMYNIKVIPCQVQREFMDSGIQVLELL